MDAIVVTDLLLQAQIGVPEEERAEPQNVIVSFEVTLDLRAAGGSDELSDTLDYGALVSGVEEVVREVPVRLIEHLAERISRFLLARPGVVGVTVEVAKEKPPIPQKVGRIAMRVERER